LTRCHERYLDAFCRVVWTFSKNKRLNLESFDTELFITEVEQLPVPRHRLKAIIKGKSLYMLDIVQYF